MIQIVKTIKGVAKRAIIKDWDNQKRSHNWVAVLVIVVIIGGALIQWHDYPWNGNPVTWAHAAGLYEQGIAAEQQHNTPLAISKVSEAARLYPGDSRFYAKQAKLLTHQNQLQEAIDAWHNYLKVKPDQVEALVTVAQLQATSGNMVAAMNDVDAALKLSPANAEALSLKALLLLSENQPAQAKAIFDKTQTAPKETARFWNFAGTYYARTQQMNEAETAFRQASQMEPLNPLYAGALGSFLLGQDKLDEALMLFKRASKLDPESDKFWSSLAAIYYKKGEVEPAIENLQKAIALQPTDAQRLLTLGDMQFQIKDYSAAADSYKRVCELRPGYAPAWDKQIDSLVKAKKSAEAKVVVSRFLHLSPRNENNPAGWCYLAQLLQEEGSKQEAKAAYQHAAMLAGNNAKMGQFCQKKLLELEKQ